MSGERFITFCKVANIFLMCDKILCEESDRFYFCNEILCHFRLNNAHFELDFYLLYKKDSKFAKRSYSNLRDT